MITNFFILTGYKDHHDYSLFQYWRYISDSLQTFINKTREIIYFSTVLLSFIQTLNRVHILLLHMMLFSWHIVRIVHVFCVFVIVTQWKIFYPVLVSYILYHRMKVRCEMKTWWDFLGYFFTVHWSGAAQCSYCKLFVFWSNCLVAIWNMVEQLCCLRVPVLQWNKHSRSSCQDFFS